MPTYDDKRILPRNALHRSLPAVVVGLWMITNPAGRCDDDELLAIIAKTGPLGAGSAAAREARDELAQRSLTILPSLFVAMDTTNPVAANWYRTIFEEVVTRERLAGTAHWPLRFLKEYASDEERPGKVRRLALKLIDDLEPEFREQWLLTRLTDDEFRREAIALTLEAGDRALNNQDNAAAVSAFRKAFENARDRAQVTESAKRLRSLGETANVITQLGLVTDWWVVGPFDAPEKSGFGLTFEPEHEVNLKTVYLGQNGRNISWSRHQTSDPLGQINLVTVLGKTDEAVAYAWTEITVAQERKAQLRCGADDCCLVWLNSETVSAHEQWLNGIRFDRFTTAITLKAGRNSILVKICQGPQHKNPEVFNNWSLQLRLCDEDGRGIPFASALPSIAPE